MRRWSEMGVTGKSASSSVPEDIVPRLRASGGQSDHGAPKPREVLEPPPQPRSPSRSRRPSRGRRAPAAAGAAPAPPRPSPNRPPAAVGRSAAAPQARQAAPAPASPRRARGPRPCTVIHGRHPADDRREDRAGRPAEIVKILFMAGEMVTATQSLSDEAIELVADGARARGRDRRASRTSSRTRTRARTIDEAGSCRRAAGRHRHGPRRPRQDPAARRDPQDRRGRPASSAASRSTSAPTRSHVGDREITFIDTPGHEAFTAMRARGAEVTDIAVLVVAADDGVMPQTIEALDHAKAAGVPIIVAVNKVDKEEADPQRVRQQLVEQGIVPSEWGGDVRVRRRVGEGAARTSTRCSRRSWWWPTSRSCKGDPTGRARGAVLEAHLDKGRGPVATRARPEGHAATWATRSCRGTAYGRRSARCWTRTGSRSTRPGPSKPVQVLGLVARPRRRATTSARSRTSARPATSPQEREAQAPARPSWSRPARRRCRAAARRPERRDPRR